MIGHLLQDDTVAYAESVATCEPGQESSAWTGVGDPVVAVVVAAAEPELAVAETA